MILPIIIWPNSILRKKSEAIDPLLIPNLRQIAMDMIETMDGASGAGLSAVQIGQQLRIFVMRDSDAPGGRRICFNPKIVQRSPEKDLVAEGCLSIPGIYEDVMRHVWVDVVYHDEFGVEMARNTLRGFAAQVFQHELDHLDGKMYPDRMDPGAKDRLRNRIKQARR